MMTFGFILAVICTISYSLKEITTKHNLRGVDSNLLILLLSGLSILFWFPILLFQGIPKVDYIFWGIFFLSGTLFYIGKLFYFKALKDSDISYIATLKGFIPIGVVILGFFILNEKPNLYGLTGIVLVIIGVYTLNVQKNHKKLYDPIKYLFSNKGMQLYFVTIICYSFTNVFDKYGVMNSTPIFWAFLMNIFLFLSSFFSLGKSNKIEYTILIKNFKFLSLTFLLYIISYLTHMLALQYIFASYMAAIKVSSMLLSIIIGGLIFKENNILKRSFVGIIIILGVLLIYFG